MKNVFFYLALFIQLTVSMLPFLPGFLTYVAALFFVVYLVASGVNVSKAYSSWMIVVYGFFSLSMLWALRWQISAWKLVYDLLPVFITTFAVYSFLTRSPGNLKRVLWVFLVALFVYFVYVLFNLGDIQSLAEGERIGTTINENMGFENDDSVRFNSNMIGMNLCYLLFVGYILLFKNQKSFFLRIASVLVAAIVVYLIFMTGSRKSFILLLLPLVVFPLLSMNRAKTLLVIPLIVIVVIAAIYAIMNVPSLYNVIGYRFEDMFNILSNSTSGGEDISRMILVQYGIEWFQDQPILGYGINNFRVLSDNTVLFAGRNFYAHNNYIELLVGVGIVGFLIYYSCYFYFWKKLRKNVAGNQLNTWAVVLIMTNLFLDVAMVSYYSLINNLVICICFFAVANTKSIFYQNQI